jgi:hypothetical protein
VQELRVELRIALQFGRGVAEQRLDLRADVRDRVAIVRRRDQGHERESLGQGAILALGLVEPLGRVGEHGARCDGFALVRNRSEGHRDDDLLPVLPRVSEVATLDALALRHSLEGIEDVTALVFGAQQGDVTPRDVLCGMAVDPLGTPVPAQDVPAEIEPDDRLGRVSANGVELTGVASALSFGSTEAVGGEAGQDRQREPNGQGEDRPRRLIRDEGEEQSPAGGGDQSAPARPGGEGDRGGDQHRQRGGYLRRGVVEQREGNRDGGLEHEAGQGHEPSVRSEPLGQQLGGRSNCHSVRRRLLRAWDREP